MPPIRRRRCRTWSVAIAFVSHAYPSYIHQITAKMTITWATAAAPPRSTSTAVSWVIVKTKTRSKKSSSVVTRALRSGSSWDMLVCSPTRGHSTTCGLM